MSETAARGLGRICKWPSGYAMTLGIAPDGGAVRCCSGHEKASEAKNHGLARLVEVAANVGDWDVAAWDTLVDSEPSTAPLSAPQHPPRVGGPGEGGEGL